MRVAPWKRRMGSGCAAALMLCMFAPGEASADGEPPYPNPKIAHVWTYHHSDGPSFTFGRIYRMNFGVKDALPSTTVTLQLFGCDNAPLGAFTRTGEGTFDVHAELDEAAENNVGNLHFTATWAAPGYTPFVQDGNVYHPNQEVAAQICAGTFVPTVRVEPPNVKVTSWSKKLGRAKVGRTVKVTPTVAPETQVRYWWNLKMGPTKNKHIGNDTTRAVKIRPWMKGGRLSVSVTVDREGYDGRSRTLVFGPVR